MSKRMPKMPKIGSTLACPKHGKKAPAWLICKHVVLGGIPPYICNKGVVLCRDCYQTAQEVKGVLRFDQSIVKEHFGFICENCVHDRYGPPHWSREALWDSFESFLAQVSPLIPDPTALDELLIASVVHRHFLENAGNWQPLDEIIENTKQMIEESTPPIVLN